MADNDTPTRAANKEKAEGDRSTAQHNADVPNSESSTDRGYRDANRDHAGGITNRPIEEEAENQNALPERGLSQADERARRNEDSTR
jgi:hypothetical protein